MTKNKCTYFITALITFFTINSFAQTGDFISGRYYTWDGQKVEGLIKHRFAAGFGEGPDNDIRFQKDDAAKKITLTTADVKSFVIGLDSFTVVKDFTINAFASYREDFAKVILSGKINLYEHFSTVTTKVGFGYINSPVSSYLVCKSGIVVKIKTNSQFKEIMNQFVADDPELLEKIKSKVYKVKDLETVIRVYNAKYPNDQLSVN